MARVRCAGCALLFSGMTAFDRHHDRDAVCLEPAGQGLVERTTVPAGVRVWGLPGARPAPGTNGRR